MAVYLECEAAARCQFVQVFFVGRELQHGRTLVYHVAHGFAGGIVLAGVDVHVGHVAAAGCSDVEVGAYAFTGKLVSVNVEQL